MKCVACLTSREWECAEYGNCDGSDTSSNSDGSSSNVGTREETVPEGVPGRLGGENRSTEGASRTHARVPAMEETNSEGGEYVSKEDYGDDYRPGKPVRVISSHKDHTLRDQQSTGRKRAAEMYPLHRDMPCEWRQKKNCGGNKPIVGCVDGLQQARHHGPDKNTLNNDEGNVHRICHTCHNRWHTVNDENYDWTAVPPPHTPVDCSTGELLQNELYWQGRKLLIAKD